MQAGHPSGPVPGQTNPVAVPYAAPPTAAERAADKESERLRTGASVLRTSSGIRVGLGWALIGLGLATAAGAFVTATGSVLPVLLGAFGLIVQGVVVVLVLTNHLRTQAAMAIVLRDVARREAA
jgi:hypothetical protein